MRAHIFSNWTLVLLAFGLRVRAGEHADCLQTNPTFSLKPTCVSPPQSLSAGGQVVNNNKDMRSVYDNIYIDTGSFVIQLHPWCGNQDRNNKTANGRIELSPNLSPLHNYE